jgi:cytochrome c biogenesis protein CcmG, thiol:disulfide interchange protein DsbE
MARRAKIVLQAAAVSVVALLIALLGWQVTREENTGGVAAALASGGTPAAPDFDLERLDEDGSLQLSAEEGRRVVVVNFWASWCLPCKDEAGILEAAWLRWRDRGVLFVGVDAQDFRSDARRFIERYETSYPHVYDGRGSTLGRYGVTGFPETYFIDKNGRLVGERVQGPVSAEQLDRNIELALEADA